MKTPNCDKRRVGAWTLSLNAKRPNTVNADGPKWSDSGIRYPDGRIAWDFAERVPAGVKSAARRMLSACRGWPDAPLGGPRKRRR